MKKLFVLISLSLLFLGSCTQGSQGLFYTVEKEQKTEDADKALPNTVSVYNMAELGSNYYLAALSFYYRPTAGGTWQQKDVAGFTGGRGRVLSLGTVGANLMVAVAKNDYTDSALFTTTDPLNGPYTQVTALTGNLYERCIFPGSGGLYIGAQTQVSTDPLQYRYDVFYTSDGTTASKINLTGIEFYQPPIQSAHKNNVAPFFIISQSQILTGTSPSAGFTVVPRVPALGATLATTDPLGGIGYNGARFFLTTQKGNFFTSGDGSTWTQGTPGGFKVRSTDNKPASLSRVAIFDDGSQRILALTDLAGGNVAGTGYVEIYDNAGTWTLRAPLDTVDPNNYSSTVLSTSTLTNFHISGTAGSQVLFLGTAGNGLWKRDSEKKWAWE